MLVRLIGEMLIAERAPKALRALLADLPGHQALLAQ
jgi:hypothetical protein